MKNSVKNHAIRPIICPSKFEQVQNFEMDKITITPYPATIRAYRDFFIIFVAGKAIVIKMKEKNICLTLNF